MAAAGGGGRERGLRAAAAPKHEAMARTQPLLLSTLLLLLLLHAHAASVAPSAKGVRMGSKCVASVPLARGEMAATCRARARLLRATRREGANCAFSPATAPAIADTPLHTPPSARALSTTTLLMGCSSAWPLPSRAGWWLRFGERESNALLRGPCPAASALYSVAHGVCCGRAACQVGVPMPPHEWGMGAQCVTADATCTIADNVRLPPCSGAGSAGPPCRPPEAQQALRAAGLDLLRQSKPPLLVLVSGHKVGTVLSRDLARAMERELGLPVATGMRTPYHPCLWPAAMASVEAVRLRGGDDSLAVERGAVEDATARREAALTTTTDKCFEVRVWHLSSNINPG